MASHTYSLWLTPAGDARTSLARLIAELAEQHGGPRFPPHITLLGSIVGTDDEIGRLAGEVARQLVPQRVEFDGLGAENLYFRTLYLVVKPTSAVMAANALARRAFADERTDPFRPHLSLVYGDYSAEIKGAISAAIQARLPAGCDVRALDVYQTEPPVDAWRLAHRFPLTTGL
jgi:2'-5' RNA ligase